MVLLADCLVQVLVVQYVWSVEIRPRGDRRPCSSPHLLSGLSTYCCDPCCFSYLIAAAALPGKPLESPAANSSAATPYAESHEHGGSSDGHSCGGANPSSPDSEKGDDDRRGGDATINGAGDVNGGGGCCAGADSSAREPGPAKPAAAAAAGHEDVLKGMEGMSAGALVASFRRAQEERVTLYRKFNG